MHEGSASARGATDGQALSVPISSALELHVQLLKLSSLINRPMREGVADPSGISVINDNEPRHGFDVL